MLKIFSLLLASNCCCLLLMLLLWPRDKGDKVPTLWCSRTFSLPVACCCCPTILGLLWSWFVGAVNNPVVVGQFLDNRPTADTGAAWSTGLPPSPLPIFTWNLNLTLNQIEMNIVDIRSKLKSKFLGQHWRRLILIYGITSLSSSSFYPSLPPLSLLIFQHLKKRKMIENFVNNSTH